MTRRRIGSTDCVHAGAGRRDVSSSVTAPIVHSAPFIFGSTEELIELVEGRSKRQQPEYGRMGNPTVTAVEKRLAALEGAERAQLFGSGMAAVTSLFLAFLESGAHLVLTQDCYKRSRDFAAEFLSKFDVRTSVVAPSLDAIGEAITPETRMIFTETPTNPCLYVVDVEGLAELGRRRGVMTVVDSTFATPVNLRPLDFGIDLVVHSATKYLGGHNDLIAGVLAGKQELVEPVSELLATLGGICDPNTAFLLERGLKTLALRVARHNSNGQAVAQYLESHPKVSRVLYPGLASAPERDIATRQMNGFGGVVSFFIDGDLEQTRRFVDNLRIPLLAPSLGGVESLVEQVVFMGYWDVPREERQALGMHDNLVRLALGIEDVEDIIEDLGQALQKV